MVDADLFYPFVTVQDGFYMGYLLHYKRSGSVLLLVMIVMLALLAAGLTAVQIGRDNRIRAIRTQADITARYAADAGIARTLFAMNKMLAAGTWATGTPPAFVNEPLTGSEAVYSASVSGTLASGYQITSTGQAKNASRAVRATLALANPFSLNFAVLTQNSIKLDGSSVISGYNSLDVSQTNLPVSIGTLSDAPGAIDIKNGAMVNGDVYIGLIGNPQTGVLLKSRTDVKGELLNQPPPLPVLATIDAPSLAGKGNISGSSVTLTAADTGSYSSIDISNNGTLQVNGNCVLVVTGDIRLRNAATINIGSSGSLTIYLYGNLIGDNASGVYNESKIPGKFKLYGVGPAGQQINLKNSADFYGAVYAPKADVTIYNGGNIYGAVVVNSFELKNSGNVMYDRALQNTTVSDQGAMFIIVRWEEL